MPTIPKIIILHNIVTPYRLALFDALAASYKVDVLFCRESSRTRKWPTAIDECNFTYKILRSFVAGPLVCNPAMLLELIRRRADVYILADNEENIISIILFVVFAKLLKKPVIVWSEHTETTYSGGGRTGVMYNFLKKLESMYRVWLFKNAGAFLSMSGKYTDTYLKNRRVPKHLIFTNTQVMPAALLPAPTSEQEHKIKRQQPYIVYLGYFRPEKNLIALLKSFKQAKTGDMRLVLAGIGPQQAVLQATADHDPAISFAGYADSQTRANILAGASALVLPSLYEPWGLVVNESLYYGAPVLCSDAVAASSLITSGKTGLIYPAGQNGALQACLEKFCTSKPLQSELKQNIATIDRPTLCDAKQGTRHFKAAVRYVLKNGASKEVRANPI